jgi:hypothetical protein
VAVAVVAVVVLVAAVVVHSTAVASATSRDKRRASIKRLLGRYFAHPFVYLL